MDTRIIIETKTEQMSWFAFDSAHKRIIIANKDKVCNVDFESFEF